MLQYILDLPKLAFCSSHIRLKKENIANAILLAPSEGKKITMMLPSKRFTNLIHLCHNPQNI
jgi:hypothetical protein